MLSAFLILDGGHFSRIEHAGLRGYQMDTPHGFLHHIQFTFDENMAVIESN